MSSPRPSSSSSSSASSSNNSKDKLERFRKRLLLATDEAKAQHTRIEKLYQDLAAELEKLGDEHKQQIATDLNNLEQRQREIEAKEAQHREIAERIRKVSRQATASKVTLNVGGQKHETSIETLTSEEDTFFSIMFGSQFASPVDENGEVFIDRNPRHFSIILDHLRRIDVTKLIYDLPLTERALFEQEVDFYQIKSLILLTRRPTWRPDVTNRTNDVDLVVTAEGFSIKSNHSRSYCAVWGNTGFITGVHRWRVRVDHVSDGFPLVLGVCTKHELQACYTSGLASMLSKTWSVSRGLYKYERDQGQELSKEQQAKWYNGCIVTVVLDCNNGKLQIGNIVINIPPRQELHPLFVLYSDTDRLTLLT